jgi:hypothetical protein
MDDFLYNLRKSVEERSKPGNRYADGNTNRGGDRRCGMDRRNRKPQKPHSDRRGYPPYNRNLHEIRVLLERFVEGQAQQQAADEKRLELETRRTEALERIADSLGELTNTQAAGVNDPMDSFDPQVVAEKAGQGVTTQADEPEPDTPAALMTFLRSRGTSFEKIAQALEAKGFPTVSGRGRWRGQTVKRELKKLGVVG